MKKRIIGIILCVVTAAVVGVCGATVNAFAYDLTISDWGIEYFNKLDTGIYWYADPDDDVPTADYTVKKDKPTIIFTHGWKPQGESRVREGLSLKSRTETALASKGFDEYKYDSEFYRYYIEKGYNVGVFYWNQFADAEGREDVMLPSFAVDKKIWASNDGKNMTYITYDSADAKVGTRTAIDDPSNPKKSVAVIFGEAIVEQLGRDFSGTLQIAGHSMGGQLALAVSEYLCVQKDNGNIGENLLPDRVTLLDPYLNAVTRMKEDVTVDHTGKTYKYDSASGIEVFTVQFAADAAENIRKHGIPIEGYAANVGMCVQNYKEILSLLPKYSDLMNEVTEKLKNNCVWVSMAGMGLYGGFDPTHVMSVDWYFSTNNMRPLKSDEGLDVPCAQLETAKLQSLIGLTFLQNTPSGINPMYYDESTYSLVNFDDMQPYDSDEAQGLVYGKVAIEGKGKDVTVKLVNADNEVKAKATVDDAGYYYLTGVAAGQYEVKLFAGEKEVASAGQVSVANSPIPVRAEDTEVKIASADLYAYVIIALVALMVVAVVISVICLCVRNSRRRAARKNA